jgi:hypothetical protein
MSARFHELKLHAFRAAFIAAGAFVAAITTTHRVEAVSPQVRAACANDYLSNCSRFKPESAETRRCMRAVGHRLSKGCIQALVAAGEVSKSEIARRSASARR